MKKKKLIIIIVILIVAIAGGLYYYEYSTKMFFNAMSSSSNEMKNKEVTSCDRNYKNATLTMKINNLETNDDIDITIKDPKGEVIDNFIVKANEKKNYEKTFKGKKGDYTVEFNKDNDKSIYQYEIKYDMDNKWWRYKTTYAIVATVNGSSKR